MTTNLLHALPSHFSLSKKNPFRVWVPLSSLSVRPLAALGGLRTSKPKILTGSKAYTSVPWFRNLASLSLVPSLTVPFLSWCLTRIPDWFWLVPDRPLSISAAL